MLDHDVFQFNGDESLYCPFGNEHLKEQYFKSEIGNVLQLSDRANGVESETIPVF